MVKTLQKVQQEDLRMKEIFAKKQEYLAEKKAKALQNRRNTIKRKNRKRCAEISAKGAKAKRPKNKE